MKRSSEPEKESKTIGPPNRKGYTKTLGTYTTTTRISIITLHMQSPILKYQSLRREHRALVDHWNLFQTQNLYHQTIHRSLSEADLLLLSLVLTGWQVLGKHSQGLLHRRIRPLLTKVNRKRQQRRQLTHQQSNILQSYSIWAHHQEPEEKPNQIFEISTTTSV